MTGSGLSDRQIILLDGSSEAPLSALGGKAWGINAMRRMRIPVPPAFAITTDACRRYYSNGRRLPDTVRLQIPAAISQLEQETERRFGGGSHPLLISVRSGAARSMPGMMDTILNLGFTAEVKSALAETHGHAFAEDVASRFDDHFRKVVGVAPPAEPFEQLHMACEAVFASWQSPRARSYRDRYGHSHDDGTAITVQSMVFGNADASSGTGVLFTRDPLSGDKMPFGEWLPCAQGEDVVSGRFDAMPLATMGDALPAAFAQLMEAAQKLEEHAGEVQDIEFTIETGKLWILQTRNAKRSPRAAIRFAVQLGLEGLKSQREALEAVSLEQLRLALAPSIDAEAAASAEILARGTPACPGIGTGLAVVDPDIAEETFEGGQDVVLARPTTDPDDIHGMAVARGVITDVGGATSHAAVVCRELGIAAIVGCGDGTAARLAGREVTIDGTSGIVYAGRLPSGPAMDSNADDLKVLADWGRADGGPHGAQLARHLRSL